MLLILRRIAGPGMRIPLLLLALCCSALIRAEEISQHPQSTKTPIQRDIRLTLSALPNDWDGKLENEDTGDTVEDSDTLDSTGWVAVDYQATIGRDTLGAIIGGGLDSIGYRWEYREVISDSVLMVHNSLW